MNTETENIWREDRFSLEKLGEDYSQILLNIQTPAVIGLGSPFGTGKTFFTKCWRKTLKNQGYQCLHFDAWQTDFAESSLAPLIAQMSKQLPSNGKARKALNKMKSSANEILKSGAKKVVSTAASAATQGIVSADKVENIFFPQQDVDTYIKTEKSIDKLKKGLLELVENSQEQRVFFFVDEIDRCRPDFALSTLELIKHLFDVKGVVFILNFDREHLIGTLMPGASNEEQRESYSRRFFDLELSLPKPQFTKEFVVSLLQKRGVPDEMMGQDPNSYYTGCFYLADSLADQGNLFNLSIREMDRITHAIAAILLQKISHNGLIIPDLIALLLILKLRDEKIYKKLIIGKITFEEFFTKLSPILANGEKRLMDVSHDRYGRSLWSSILLLFEPYSALNSKKSDAKKRKDIMESEEKKQPYIWLEKCYSNAGQYLESMGHRFGFNRNNPQEIRNYLDYLINPPAQRR